MLLLSAGSCAQQPDPQPTTTPSPISLKAAPLFRRVALFPAYLNKPEGPTSAEIVALTPDGKTAVYADSLGGGLGFVDITVPASPKPGGWMALEGEPTSVALFEDKALVACDDGNYSGHLDVVNLRERKVERTLSLPGQPDAISVSPDKQFAAVVIENESQKNFPEPPAGSLVIFKLIGAPETWSQSTVNLTGLAQVHPEDPEPEYVSINDHNIGAVTLQENNHIVLVDLAKAEVSGHFSAGAQNLAGGEVPREPDSVAWCSAGIATADEGDWKGGGRSFTVYSEKGKVLYNSGKLTEQLAKNLGQYPEHRSELRGSEPESIMVTRFGERELLLVGCERSNLVHLFEMKGAQPHYRQSLYTSAGPESLAASPQRGLLVLASEVDKPKKNLRSYLTIYQLGAPHEDHHIVSNGIPWAALSGLTATAPGELVTIGDKALYPNQLLTLDTGSGTPTITNSVIVRRPTGEPTSFDLEGVAKANGGGYWLVAEGNKKQPHKLLRVTDDGTLAEQIRLPDEVNKQVGKRGMEGVAEVDKVVYVAFQSPWKNDPEGMGRLGRYHPDTRKWEFALYPLSKDCYLSGLSRGPEGSVAVLERDKLGREKAAHKAVYTIDRWGSSGTPLQKTLRVDLVKEFRLRGLPVPEKVEGLAFDGQAIWVVNDNDGTKNSYGETLLLKVENFFPYNTREQEGEAQP